MHNIYNTVVHLYAGVSLTFLMLLSGCNGSKTNSNVDNVQQLEEIKFTESVVPELNSFVAGIEYLPLYGSDDYPIDEITGMKFHGGHIVIGCQAHHPEIHIYDRDGKHLSTISRIGNGPGEYLEIAAFCVSGSSLYILDNYSHRINEYSLDNGSFIGSTKVDFNAWDMEMLDEKTFIFTMLPNHPAAQPDLSQPSYAVWTTTLSGERIDNYLPYAEDYYEMIGKRKYFTKSDGKVYFHSYMNPGVYEFDKDGSLGYIPFVFPKNIPESGALSFKEVSDEGYYYLSETPFFSEKFIACNIARGDEDGLFLYGRLDKTFYENDPDNITNAMGAVFGVRDNDFVSYLSDYDMYESMVEDGFQTAPQSVVELLKNDGSCLLFYKMK